MSTKIAPGVRSLEGLFGLVILKLDEPDKYTDESELIEIPEPAREMKFSGTVMHSGPGRVDIYGITHPTELEPGDKVVFGRHLGFTVELDGETYYQIDEKYIFLKVLSPDRLEPELVWDIKSPGVFYEYRYVDLDLSEESGRHRIHLLSEHGWEPAAFSADNYPTRLIWIRRDVYKFAPKIKELADSQAKNIVPVIPGAELVDLGYIAEDKNAEQRLVKALADWAADSEESEWKDELDNKIESGMFSPTGPGWVGSPAATEPVVSEWEYKQFLITAYHSEPNGPEFHEIKRLKKEGWEPDIFEDNGQRLDISRFKRAIKNRGLSV